ncbi:curli assembly protein CsgF [Indioceanicola profundi]|uniref:curli assembly protein CsgF n=1 Tax=Indioceanicola profundi TaxID=2220096 RepID=UPI0013C3F319|nr:curli assembly protein CsgF [Indioceanicola profundi]
MARIPSASLAAMCIAATFGMAASASELVYRPVNPSFGGDPYNSNHLLGTANANDRFKDPNAVDPFDLIETDPQRQLEQALRDNLISSLASQASQTIQNAGPGTYEIGGTRIVISDANGQRTTTITNLDTGATSRIVAPIPTGTPGLPGGF